MSKRILFLILLIAIVATSFQTLCLGIPFLDKWELFYHNQVLQGCAGNPWQYRVLSVWIVSGIIWTTKTLQLHHPEAVAFIAFKFIQFCILGCLAYLYYRKLGLSKERVVFGLILLSYFVTLSNYKSDFRFNTYTDIIFYLAAGLLILNKKEDLVWLVCIPAILNRETSLLIPFMLLAANVNRREKAKRIAYCLGIMAMLYLCLRLYFPGQKQVGCYGFHIGINLYLFNLLNIDTVPQMLRVFNVVPILALLNHRNYSNELRIWFWVLCPIWFVAHLFLSGIAETAVLLVPAIVFIIPAVLMEKKEQ